MYPGAFTSTTPDKAAIIMADTGATVTYAELEERSVRLAHVLYDHGLRPGDSVAMLAPNSPLYYEVYWAAMRSGLYMTAINHRLSPVEVAYIANDCGARALIADSSLTETATAIIPLTGAITLRLSVGEAIAGHGSFDEALAAASNVPPSDQPRGKDMLYSSGTTGQPKGVKAPLPPYQVNDGADPLLPLFGPMFGWDADTVYLNPSPLYHAAPLRFGGMIHSVGGTVVILPRFDAVAALVAIERYRITHSQWVPTMFVRMLKLPAAERIGHDLSSHRVAVHAAAPISVETKRAMIEWWGPILHEYYAATEAVGVTFIDSKAWLERPGTVGKAGLGIIHISDEEGNELPVGERGLVYFEREVLPFSYHNDPEKTKKAQHPLHDNWGTTGDIGYVDDDGYLFLTDRAAFMIISGGVNIYPQEVENALTLHPKVHDIAVIGVPDAEMGEAVRGFVQAAPGVETGPELETELLDYLRARIAHFKVPREIEFVDSLPRTETGKLQKHRLREGFVAAP
ncbi:acyl-CoA synthetase [Subtercola boreus]|uniref:Acyl-CoA synthetase n=1 Tax=Subtercola boreus TaxID=120213 RepID=A0A3E0VKQ2_9MICO|nr:acyl-CoA synthetase [Subtercola boreus]RFA10000.1 acyl-CoA synthetase [Subtercola boreus]TQL52854.1 fatty-acyl-CoA synthase [Subtercola boreus]